MIKCFIKFLPTERTTKGCSYPELLGYITNTVNEICEFCLPSTQQPVCHLKCPLNHEDDEVPPHLPLNEISRESDIICNITNTPVPQKYYISLFCKLCNIFILSLSMVLVNQENYGFQKCAQKQRCKNNCFKN